MAKKYRVTVDGESKNYRSQKAAYDDVVPAAKDGKSIRVYETEAGKREQLFETFNTSKHDRA